MKITAFQTHVALSTTFSLLAWLLLAPVAVAQQGGGRGPMHHGQGHDPSFQADRAVFHQLLARHDSIRREVTRLDNGVETLTESSDPETAAWIQEHVAAMARRVHERRPIRLRDPLFAELFRHADRIEIAVEDTEHGVRVRETSADPYVVQLIQAHAQVVSLFVKHGFAEAHRNHPAPPQLGAHLKKEATP